MNCPKCKEIKLKKSGYNSPYVCKACDGMWIQPDQITQLANISEEIAADSAGNKSNDERTGVCPSGHGIMIRAKVDMEEPFYLEKCTACGGVWFDKGEWHRIAQTKLAENLDNIWSKSWQRKHRKEKDREKFHEINRGLLGNKVFQAILDLSAQLKQHPEKDRAIALLQHEVYEK